MKSGREKLEIKPGIHIGCHWIRHWFGSYLAIALHHGSKRWWGIYFVVFSAEFLVGVPLFMAELVLGRAGQQGTINCFTRFAPKGSMWVIGGWLACAAALLILGWYCVVAGWGIHYVLMVLSDAFAGKSADQVGGLFHAFRACGSLNVLFQFCSWFSQAS